MRRYLFLLVAVCSMALRADFFAMRKLTHPDGQHHVYFLYDAHASLIRDIDAYSARRQEVFDFLKARLDNKQIAKYDHFAPMPNFAKDPVVIGLDERMQAVRAQLQNLIKQQADLIDVVKKYSISLIDEDWPSSGNLEKIFKGGGTVIGGSVSAEYGRYYNYIERNIARDVDIKQHDNRYFSDYVTPIVGIGKRLFGVFSAGVLQKISGVNAYFYNADVEGSNAIGERSDDDVDVRTIKQIGILFGAGYDQKNVIVAEGFIHVCAIIDKLVKHHHYSMDELVISDALKSVESEEVKTALEKIQANDITLWIKSIAASESKKLVLCDLVGKPLDLAAVFEKELTKKVDARESLTRMAESLHALAGRMR